MALLTCHECGNTVSDTAQSCPKCGAVFGKRPVEKKKLSGCLPIIGGVFALLVVSSIVRACTEDPTPTQSANQPTVSAAPTEPTAEEKLRLAECETKLNKATGLGLVTKMSNRGIYIGPTFHNITIDAKQGLFETIQCVALEGKPGGLPLPIYDGNTGKKIGRWTGSRVDLD